MGKLVFSELGWEQYLYWQSQDRKTLKRVNGLLRDILRDPWGGEGKPEPLKGRTDCWSRRIDQYHRLVYRVRPGQIEIIQCRGHYDQ